jgi:hypothetical protein
MAKTQADSRSTDFSVRLYRSLVGIYPANFRREYGEPMVQAFRDSARRAAQEGGELALLELWGRILVDTMKTVVEEHIQGGVYMTREKFIRLAGWALIFGSLFILTGWLAESRPDYNPYNYRSLLIDLYANLAALPLVSLGIALTSLGMVGMFLRYGKEAGGFGRYSLGFGILSGLVSATGVIGLAVSDSEPWWSMFFLGWGLQSLFLAMFGWVNLRHNLLPRWNGLPFLTGIWMPSFMAISIVYEQATGSWLELPEAIFLIIFVVMCGGLAGLGYLMQSPANPTDPAPSAA